MKRCSGCQIDKDLSEFYKRKIGPRAGRNYEKCKECMKIRGRNYYHKNRDRQLALALIRKKRSYYLKRELINKLKNKPCSDCKLIYPYYVMDFDHKYGTDKVGDIAHMMSFSLKQIEKEITKCEIVCANCHRIRTFKRAEVAKVVTARV